MSLTLIRARAEEAFHHTWAGGEVPVGPSISDGYRRAVRSEKDLAADVVLLCDIATAAATLVRLKDGSRDWSYWNEKESAWNDLRAALARLETT